MICCVASGGASKDDILASSKKATSYKTSHYSTGSTRNCKIICSYCLTIHPLLPLPKLLDPIVMQELHVYSTRKVMVEGLQSTHNCQEICLGDVIMLMSMLWHHVQVWA